MKPRHVAALALVGWYLIMSPFPQSDGKPVPLSDQVVALWRGVSGLAYAVVFTLLAVINMLNLANPLAFVYFQFSAGG
ncbi:MAG: hypothetical protein ACLQU2_26200 [Candidatus Binataceae bacterium]